MDEIKNTSLGIVADTALGIACDVGTTHLVARAYDLSSHALLGKAHTANPQARYGTDVLSRIVAAGKHPGELTHLVRDAINVITQNLCGDILPRRTVFAGNTVMLHLLRGLDPAPLGVYPYTPAYSGAFMCPGDRLGLRTERVMLLPAVGAYTGADLVAGMLAVGFDGVGNAAPGGSVLLCDLGTNGELAFRSSDGSVTCASAAAGPAFEGGGIECGRAHAPGALESVRMNRDGTLGLGFVGGGAPRGICGSGVCDAVGVMTEYGVITPDGAFVADPPARLAARVRNGKFYLTGDIYISANDVRAFQLAKSAVRSAAELLCRGEIPHTVFVSGAFGSGADSSSLRCTGTLPASFPAPKPVGNTSLAGAATVLLDPGTASLSRAEALSAVAVTLPLGGTPEFETDFLRNLSLGVY